MRILRVTLGVVVVLLLMLSAAAVWGAPRAQDDDGAGPRVVRIDPAEGDKFYIHDDLTFYFDQVMDHQSVVDAFSVEPKMAGRLSWRDRATEETENASAVTFTPNEYYDRSTTYTFTIGTEAMSVDGEPLAEPFTAQFKTERFGKYLDYMGIGYLVTAGILAIMIVWIYLRYQALRRDEARIAEVEAEDRVVRGDAVASTIGAMEHQARPEVAAPGVTDMVAPSETERNTPSGT